MKFARITFLIAGIYGLLVLIPGYFLEVPEYSFERTWGGVFPPPLTHPEFYYGFLGCAVAWQVVFLIIAKNPSRYRLIMLAALIEKFSFAIAAIVLHFQNRIAGGPFAGAMVDLLLGALFIAAYLKTPRSA